MKGTGKVDGIKKRPERGRSQVSLPFSKGAAPAHAGAWELQSETYIRLECAGKPPQPCGGRFVRRPFTWPRSAAPERQSLRDLHRQSCSSRGFNEPERLSSTVLRPVRNPRFFRESRFFPDAFLHSACRDVTVPAGPLVFAMPDGYNRDRTAEKRDMPFPSGTAYVRFSSR